MKANVLIEMIEKKCAENGFNTSDLDVCIIDPESYVNIDFNVTYDDSDIPAINVIIG